MSLEFVHMRKQIRSLDAGTNSVLFDTTYKRIKYIRNHHLTCGQSESVWTQYDINDNIHT